MSNSIDELRHHFDKKPVPNSKVLIDERDMVNAMIDAVEDENEELRKFVYDMWNDMNVYYLQHESPDSSDMDFYCDRMRELGIEV